MRDLVVMVHQFPEPDIFTLNCPTQQVLDVIADKWIVIILYCLAYDSRRYSEIHRRIDGISQKVLTQSLRKLERHGLVKRQVLSEMPLNVSYSLTSLGQTLVEPLLMLANWSRLHFAEIKFLREQYDREHQSN